MSEINTSGSQARVIEAVSEPASAAQAIGDSLCLAQRKNRRST